jgi:glutamine synthetase
MPLPWDKKTARVFCTLFRGREERERPNEYLTADCRGNLKRIHAEFEETTGFHLMAGTEPEMMWLKTDADGKPTVDALRVAPVPVRILQPKKPESR